MTKTGTAVAGTEAPSLPAIMSPAHMVAEAVRAGQFDVVDKLIALQERHEARVAKQEFDNALADAKGEFLPIYKNRTVDFPGKNDESKRTNYRYEDLAQIEAAIKPALTKYGLSYRWRVTSEVDKPVRVTCILAHRGGHFEETTLEAGRDNTGNKNGIQQIGSTLTFLQRYTLKAACGLAVSNDDDGQSAEVLDTITPEQQTALEALIEEAGAQIDKVCEWAKVDALRNMPAKMFDQAVLFLEQRKNRRRTIPA